MIITEYLNKIKEKINVFKIPWLSMIIEEHQQAGGFYSCD